MLDEAPRLMPGETADNVVPHPTGLGPSPEQRKDTAKDYARGATFIYQLIMGLALTNAARLFFVSGTTLRPLASYDPVESVLFGLLILYAVPKIIDHTAGLSYNVIQVYPRGIRGALLFLFVTILSIAEGLVFFALSNAFDQLSKDFVTFFVLVGFIFALDIVSEILALPVLRDFSRRSFSVLGLNLFILLAGAIFIYIAPSFLLWLLIGLWSLRVVFEYILSPIAIFVGRSEGVS
jgi:hypothetical protein